MQFPMATVKKNALYMGLITQVCTDFDYENDLGFAQSRLSFFTIRFFLKLECSPRMNELFQNFDIVISNNNMDIRNFLVLFAIGTAGHETSIRLKRSGLSELDLYREAIIKNN
jgi:hypothetical protein